LAERWAARLAASMAP
jgi:hypothetical protein